jgi:hypothetical protein
MAEQIGTFPTANVAPFLAACRLVRFLCVRPLQTLRLKFSLPACPAALHFFDPFAQAQS